MIASQAVRVAPPRRATLPRPRRAPLTQRRAATATRATWEVRTFVAASAAIAFLFLLALLYLSQSTAVSAAGYEVQRLQAARDELRRQNALLQVENARLDSPARIDAEAKRIGLVRAATIPVLKVETVAAKP